jgi:hypothetical protein
MMMKQTENLESLFLMLETNYNLSFIVFFVSIS